MEQAQEKPQDARAVANYILDKAPEYGITDLSPMKLMKLIFLAHGWALYFCEVPLIKEEQQPEAWDYGPVYPQVYQAVKKYVAEPIKERIINEETNFPYGNSLSKQQKGVIEAVLRRYKDKSAFQLSKITHLDNSPWALARQDFEHKISQESMKHYYTAMAQEMGLENK